MPAIVPFIPLIAAAVGATTAGVTLANQPSGPSQSQQEKQLQQQQQQQAAADAETKRKAILASLANAQEQGGGALNNPSLTDLAAVIAGLPGEATTKPGQNALQAYLGQPTSSSDTMVSSTYGLSGSMG